MEREEAIRQLILILDQSNALSDDPSNAINLINGVWDTAVFKSKRRELLPKVDNWINNIKNSPVFDELKNNDAHREILALFYSRRINEMTDLNSVRYFVGNTPAMYFIKNNDQYTCHLSTESQNMLDRVFNRNSAGRGIQDYLNRPDLVKLKEYILRGHPQEWNEYQNDEARSSLSKASLKDLGDFIQGTWQIASDEWKKSYLALLLYKKEPLIDDIIQLIATWLSDNNTIDGGISAEKITEGNLVKLCDYICSKMPDSGTPLYSLTKSLLSSKSVSLTEEQLYKYYTCRLLDQGKFRFTAMNLQNTDLFELWQRARAHGDREMVSILEGIIQGKENDWNDWESGYILFQESVFKALPISLLFSKINNLSPEECMSLLGDVVGYLNRTRVDQINKASIYWDRVKEDVIKQPVQPASDDSVRQFRDKYSQYGNDNIVLGLLNDLNNSQEKTIGCLQRILDDVKNDDSLRVFFSKDGFISVCEADQFIVRLQLLFDKMKVAEKLDLFKFIQADDSIMSLYKDNHFESSIREKVFKKNTSLWNRIKKEALSRPLDHQVPEELMKGFKEKYCQLADNNIIEELSGDLAVNFEGTLNCLRQILSDINNSASVQHINHFFDKSRFISLREKNVFIKNHQSFVDNLRLANNLQINEFLPPSIYVLNDIESVRKRSNEGYITCHIKDKITVGEKDLIDEQKRAVLTEEDNTLVINSAGGGKTTLIEAKAKYLVKNKICDPKRILVMSFNRSIAQELKDKLDNLGVKCETFHKVALGIVRQQASPTEELAGPVFDDLLNNSPGFNNVVFNYARKYEGASAKTDCLQFLSLLKSNSLQLNDVFNKHPSDNDKYFIERMIAPFINEYEERNKKNGRIDLDDAILKAIDICNKDSEKKKYDYILVDEFQDISRARYLFVEALRNENTKLFCVGDDWQSIYRFTGSDLSLFTDFKCLIDNERYGYAEISAGTTFRFGEPAISISSRFIGENQYQTKKEVKPFGDAKTDINFQPYDNQFFTARYWITQILDKIFNDNEDISENEVIFLARNKPQKKEAFPYLYEEESIIVNKGSNYHIKYKDKEIPFYSIHAAKGLEARYVIVLNCNNDSYGIPSLVAESPLLKYVLHKPDSYPYAEERRLFYVALTRAKKSTWLLYENNCQSPFIEEIQNINNALNRIPAGRQ